MFYTILILVVGILSILLFVKMKRDPKKHAAVPFKEIRPKPEFRLLEVMDMSDEHVQETVEFVMKISEDSPSQIPAPTIERNGNIVRLKLDAKLCLYDFASWVNNFMYSDDHGKTYQVRGLYPIATAEFAGKEIHNTAFTFYTPETLTPEDVSCAYFKTKEGKEFCYDLGFSTIHKVLKAKDNAEE